MTVSPSLLPYGKSDESAMAFAALANQVGRLFDPTVSEWTAPMAVNWTVTRGDYRDPIFRSVVVGRVALDAEYELQDGIAGPRDVFVRFVASIRDLPPGWRVLLAWNSGTRLEATLKGPAAVEAEARKLLEGAQVTFAAV